MKIRNVFVVSLGLSFFGWSSPGYSADRTVGVSLPEAKNPFYVVMGKGISIGLKKRGMKSIVLAANSDLNEQINNVNDLIAAKVDAILMSPMNLEGPAPVVKAANKAGIPVFFIARKLAKKYKNLWTSFVGFNLEKVGRMKGEWVKKNLKPGKVAMLLGPEGAAFAVEQERGFRQVIEPAGFKVAWAQNSSQTRENGLKLAEDALVATPGLVAIYTSNDEIALGAVQAVKASGKGGKVAILGLNGTPPALAAIHRGDLSMTVALDPFKWGLLGAKTVADFLENKKIQTSVEFKFTEAVKSNACAHMPPPLRKKFRMPAEC